MDELETRGNTYNVLGETITNGTLLRAIGAGANCTNSSQKCAVGDGLTRAQVQALSQPLSMNGDRFAQLGFVAKTGWREALTQATDWCTEGGTL